MSSKEDWFVPRFSPEKGLEIMPTVREQMQALIEEGYFDKATSAVVAVSDDKGVAVRFSGTKWECMAVATFAAGRATERFLK